MKNQIKWFTLSLLIAMIFGAKAQAADTKKQYTLVVNGYGEYTLNDSSVTKKFMRNVEFHLRDNEGNEYYAEQQSMEGVNVMPVMTIRAENHINMPTYSKGSPFFLAKAGTWEFVVREDADGGVKLTVNPIHHVETEYIIYSNGPNKRYHFKNNKVTAKMTKGTFSIYRVDDFGLAEMGAAESNLENDLLYWEFSSNNNTIGFLPGNRTNGYKMDAEGTYTFILDTEHNTVSVRKPSYAAYDTKSNTLTFYADDNRAMHEANSDETVFDTDDQENRAAWLEAGVNDNITKVVFTPSFAYARPTKMDHWFKMEKLTSIEGIEYLNTSDVTSMYALFYGCWNLPYVDVSNFVMDKVEETIHMFTLYGDSEKTLIYLPKGTTAKDYVPSTAQLSNSFNIVETTDGVNYTCENFQLFDGFDFVVPKTFTATKATLNRTLTTDNKTTVYLPFEFNATQFGKVYAYNEEKTAKDSVVFDMVMSTTANTPYIIVPNGQEISAENVVVATTNIAEKTDTVPMIGVYKKAFVPQNDYFYDDADGMLKKVTADNDVAINAGNAYFMLGNGLSADAVKVVLMGDVVTGIESTFINQRSTLDAQRSWYTIDGHMFSSKPTQKGLYIHNGKKVVIK